MQIDMALTRSKTKRKQPQPQEEEKINAINSKAAKSPSLKN